MPGRVISATAAGNATSPMANDHAQAVSVTMRHARPTCRLCDKNGIGEMSARRRSSVRPRVVVSTPMQTVTPANKV